MLLQTQPSGLALDKMNERYSFCSAALSDTQDRLKRKTLTLTDEMKDRLLDFWLIRNDAQNYMTFGDPAARLRIPI